MGGNRGYCPGGIPPHCHIPSTRLPTRCAMGRRACWGDVPPGHAVPVHGPATASNGTQPVSGACAMPGQRFVPNRCPRPLAPLPSGTGVPVHDLLPRPRPGPPMNVCEQSTRCTRPPTFSVRPYGRRRERIEVCTQHLSVAVSWMLKRFGGPLLIYRTDRQE